MIYAVISDVHANLEALEAVLRDIERHKADGIIDLGDRLGYGPSPDETLRMMCNIPTVEGNHEYSMQPQDHTQRMWKATHSYTRAVWLCQNRQILNGHRKLIEDLPQIIERSYDSTGAKLIFSHTGIHPRGTFLYITLTGKEKISTAAKHQFKKMQFGDVLFIGHSHKPEIFNEYFGTADDGSPFISNQHIGMAPEQYLLLMPTETKTIINVGSVGQPRDGDQRACYALFNTKIHAVKYRRVPYNIDKTCAKIQKMDLDPKIRDVLCKRLKAAR